MSHEELIQRLCDDGREVDSRQKLSRPTDPRRRGAMLGFKIVRAIKDPQSSRRRWSEERQSEAEMKATNEDQDKYWAHRWATLQVNSFGDLET